MTKRIALALLVAALLACGGGVPSAITPDSVATVSSDWDGSAPFVCGATQSKTIRGVSAKLDGTAVTAQGMCKLTIENSTIESTGTALEASGQAEVTLVNCIIKGAPAIFATGASTVAGSSDLQGETKTSGTGRIQVSQQASTGAAATPSAAPAVAPEEPAAPSASKPASKPAPPPKPQAPNCHDLYSQCDWDRHCASIGDASERSACSDGCWEYANSQGCEN